MPKAQLDSSKPAMVLTIKELMKLPAGNRRLKLNLTTPDNRLIVSEYALYKWAQAYRDDAVVRIEVERSTATELTGKLGNPK